MFLIAQMWHRRSALKLKGWSICLNKGDLDDMIGDDANFHESKAAREWLSIRTWGGLGGVNGLYSFGLNIIYHDQIEQALKLRSMEISAPGTMKDYHQMKFKPDYYSTYLL